ncbi:MAG: hypothetical protein KBS41_02530 [Oscillospiraceae bacterium]|nr:hypothetical protein [Candidatus Equicaccousia limihippi]
MWFYILIFLFFVLAVWGLTFIFEHLWLSLLRPKDDPPPTVIITLKPQICYQQLAYIKEKIRWQKGEDIYLADLSNLNEDEKKSCRVIIKDSRFMAEYRNL